MARQSEARTPQYGMATLAHTPKSASGARKPPGEPCDHITATWKRDLRRRLLAWYAHMARDLPWRRTRRPYQIWVSEIMLQQTQVPTVEAYFPRFIKVFPTLKALAHATEEQVLRQWEGLGYYRRARQLYRTARLLVRDHGARFPRDEAALRALPGIGRYTAGAILSIAFDQRRPILEANTRRLYSRLLAYHGDPRRRAAEEIFWRAAEDWLPHRRVDAFNQALMELGSRICTPRAPRCGECPLAPLCPTCRLGLQEVIPPPRAKPKVLAVREAAVVVRRGRTVALYRRGDHGRWAGMWDYPRFAIQARGAALEGEVRAKLAELTGLHVDAMTKLATIRHGVTNHRITLECFAARLSPNNTHRRRRGAVRWVKLSDLDPYPLSVTARRLSQIAGASVGQAPRA